MPREGGLAHGDEMRLRKAEIKRRIAAGEEMVHCVLDDPALKNAYLRQVLGWQHNWGNHKVQRTMARLSAFNPVCPALTEEQRATLSYILTQEQGWPNLGGSRESR